MLYPLLSFLFFYPVLFLSFMTWPMTSTYLFLCQFCSSGYHERDRSRDTNDVFISCILMVDSSHNSSFSLKTRHSLNCSQRALLYSVSPMRIPGLFCCWEIWTVALFYFVCLLFFYSGSPIKSLSRSFCLHKESPSFSVVIFLFVPVVGRMGWEVSWYHQRTSLTEQQIAIVGAWWQKTACEWNEAANGNYLGKLSRKNSNRTVYLQNRWRCWLCWLQSMTMPAKLFSIKP